MNHVRALKSLRRLRVVLPAIRGIQFRSISVCARVCAHADDNRRGDGRVVGATSKTAPGTRKQVTMKEALAELSATVAMEPPPPSSNACVHTLNQSLYKHPITTSTVYLYHNLVYASALYGLLTVLGVNPPAELGLASAINAVTRRVRTPVCMGAAALLVKLRPDLSELKLSTLLRVPLALQEARVRELEAEATGKPVPSPPATRYSSVCTHTHAFQTPAPGTAPAPTGGGAAASGPHSSGWWSSFREWGRDVAQDVKRVSVPLEGNAPLPPWTSRLGLKLRSSRALRAVLGVSDKVMNAGGFLDRYGLAYVFAGRAVATTQLLAVTALLRAGVDISPMLEYFGGAGELVADFMARWTLGCIMINLAYPWVLQYGVGNVSNAIGDRIDKVAHSLHEAEEEARRRGEEMRRR